MIDSFRGDNRWLSNFEEVPNLFAFGQLIPTTEHGYQAAKCEDISERKTILAAKSPYDAKRMGMKVQLRNNWEDVKEQVMHTLLCRKFADMNLRNRLLATGEKCLVEGNNWGDRYWGAIKVNTYSTEFVDAIWWPPGATLHDNQELWLGENRLGIILMRVRRELRALREL